MNQTMKKPLAIAALAFLAASASTATLAQTSTAPADTPAQSRADVKTQTRQAGATGTLQPAGESPDPSGDTAPTRASHKRAVHHPHHTSTNETVSHPAKRVTPDEHATAPSKTPEGMEEPKK